MKVALALDGLRETLGMKGLRGVSITTLKQSDQSHALWCNAEILPEEAGILSHLL